MNTREIWSDILCPFCYIGKRRFQAALDATLLTGESLARSLLTFYSTLIFLFGALIIVTGPNVVTPLLHPTS